MKEFFKKNWFLVVIAAILIVFAVYYGINQKQNEAVSVATKQQDGNYLVYSSGDHSMTADELYDKLNESYGTSAAFNSLFRAVIDASVETTEELNTYATNYATYVMQYYDEATILNALQQSGYDSIDQLTNYCLNTLKQNKMMTDYFTKNYDKYAPAYITAVNPRKVSHILVKVEDIQSSTDSDGNITYTANMTDEEKTKLSNVKEALKTKSLAEVAKEFSDDSSAETGGYIGIIDENSKSNYVTEFSDVAMSQEFGKVSEPVLSQYGYHFILTEEATKEDLLADSTFMNGLMSGYQYSTIKAVKEKIDELGFKINDENLIKLIDDYCAQDDSDVQAAKTAIESVGTK